MKLRMIKNDQDYQKTLKRIEELFDSKSNTPQGDELEILSFLVEDYENINYPIDFPDPIEAIKFKMEQMELNQKDLAKIIGLKSRASEILSRKRPMSINIIRKLSKALSIPADILIQPYKTI